MKVVGIIIESNPFHNGHKYLIDQVKENLNPDLLIALSSGYFTMRGETSLLTKKNKTKILLDAGFDIVIDFPIYQLLNSSDYFGKNAVDILAKTNITHLAFGIEANNIDKLLSIAKIMSSSSYQESVSNKIREHLSYKKAIQQSLIENTTEDLETIDLLMNSNNTLAFGYLNALKKYPNILPYAIKRIGNNEENITLDSFPSGTALRENYLNNKDISNFLPYNSNLLSNFESYDIKFKAIIENLFINDPINYRQLLHITEGIENYIFKNYNKNLTLNENIQLLSNKKYSKSRIRRTLLSMCLQMPKELDFDNTNIRILGFNKLGEDYLKKIDGTLIMNISKNNNKLFEYDLKASKLYDILTNNNTYAEEYQFPLKGE